MKYLDNKKIFLAGATGLAGFHILSNIVSSRPNSTIRACIHSRNRPTITQHNIEYSKGDLRNQDDCRRLLKGCDCAIMTAAETGGAAVLNSEPWRQVNDNLIMYSRFLEACALENVHRIVCVVSATVYQESEKPCREDDLDLNSDPYPAYFGVGWVNRFIEKLCAFWHRERGIEILIARTSNIFGPYASFDPSRSNFIPAIVRKAVDKMDPFEVWGSPDVVRDTIFAGDFASAVVEMADRDEIKFDIFNVGSGEVTTVKDVVVWALKYAQHEPSRIEYNTTRPSTIKLRALDCSKIRGKLSWAPGTTVEDGIRRTVEWWKQNRQEWDK